MHLIILKYFFLHSEKYFQIVEPLAVFLMAELLGLMELLHSVSIVHADIKPDNFLVRHTPASK